MKRKILTMLMCVAMVTSLTGCGGEEPVGEAAMKSEPVTLVYAEMNPLDTIAGETAIAFKEKVEEISEGNITIDIQHSGVLGDETTVVEAMMKGESTMDMARISPVALPEQSGKKSMLLSLPFMFESHEHFWNFASSELADMMLAEPVSQSKTMVLKSSGFLFVGNALLES